jgi:hypothetical protein
LAARPKPALERITKTLRKQENSTQTILHSGVKIGSQGFEPRRRKPRPIP